MNTVNHKGIDYWKNDEETNHKWFYWEPNFGFEIFPLDDIETIRILERKLRKEKLKRVKCKKN